MVNAVGNGLVRNKQNNGGRRIGEEYMNSTMCGRLTNQPLVSGVRTLLIDDKARICHQLHTYGFDPT